MKTQAENEWVSKNGFAPDANKDKMIILFGTETEIGIARDTEENLDVVAESMALVRSATKSGVLMRWDYECEDPARRHARISRRAIAAGHR